jgi:hypothetical protein
MLQTVYREIDFDDEMAARQQRDAHLAELQAQGMECVGENLTTPSRAGAFLPWLRLHPYDQR